MGKTAVIYATGMTKHTKAIAEYIASKTNGDVFNLKEITKIDLSGYDTVVIGTGVHAGSPYKQVVEYLNTNRDTLASKKLSLFISCMYSGDKGNRQCDALARKLEIQKAVYFNKKSDEMNDAGLPKAVDDFIAGL